MDDESKQSPDRQVECPACHHTVPASSMTSVSGRQLCLSCAGAWFETRTKTARPMAGAKAPRYFCSATTAWYIASWMRASVRQPALSTNGFGAPALSFAYFSCIRYCAG
jgi:hypothetical protein